MSAMKRRDFIKVGGALVLASAIPGSLRAAVASGSNRHPDLEIELRAVKGHVPLLKGRPTEVLRYQGRVLAGDPMALVAMPDSYLGPTLRLRRGQRVRVHFINALDEPSIIHWHGLHMPADMDGHPRYAVPPGGRYQYDFEVRNRAGTYWYHPHPMGLTASQVYHGLTGVLLIEDEEEQALALPAGEYDLPLVIQDRRIDTSNQFRYIGTGMSSMMDNMRGFLGDRVLVNGHPDYVKEVEARPYRLRLINASNARIYKLTLKNGQPLTVIGTDGGLLAQPASVPYVTLAPAQRTELWLDFSQYPAGEQIELYSQSFNGVMEMMGGGMKCGGMMSGGMMGGPSNGDELPVMKFQITQQRASSKSLSVSTLPVTLVHLPKPDIATAINASRPRIFRLTMEHMNWGINGREFSMLDVADEEKVHLDTTEIWEFDNTASQGMMGAMAHPMHIHDVQFQVLSRQTTAAQFADSTDLKEGYLDQGWRDTVLVMPGERVRLLVRFENYSGLYLYHCHNLEHAAMGMMRNYQIV